MDERQGHSGPPPDDFSRTTPNIRLPQRGPAGPGPAPPPQQQPPRQTGGRRIPVWVWFVGGGGLLLVAAVALFLVYFFLLAESGFTLIVRGAPPGSDVFVDNVRRGVTSADGSIRVPGLKSGKRLLRVSHAGHEDFNTTVTGKDGEVKTVVAQLVATGAPPPEPTGLPNEIDYTGPMILIPAGEFTMGDDTQRPEEKPAHPVTLPDFYIDKFEVTNEQYKKFCDETRRPLPVNPWWNEQYMQKNPRAPVVGVSWSDAAAYARWAGKRLPTEEEWEKAASWDAAAKKKRRWPWGDAADPSRARAGGANGPVDIGQFASGASAYGVHDLAGNVAEWVDNYFQPYQGNTASDPEFGTKNRVIRGGHFRSEADDTRTTRRFYAPPEFSTAEKRERSWLIGFRCAVLADDPKLRERIGSQK